jgi:hypothetical protein
MASLSKKKKNFFNIQEGSSSQNWVVHGCHGKNLSKDVLAATYGNLDKQSGKTSDNDLFDKGNSQNESAGLVLCTASGMFGMQNETTLFVASVGISLISAPSTIL